MEARRADRTGLMKGKEEMRGRGRKEQNDRRMTRRGSVRGTRMSNNNRGKRNSGKIKESKNIMGKENPSGRGRQNER